MKGVPNPLVHACAASRALLEGRIEHCRLALADRGTLDAIREPCGRFYAARFLAYSGDHELALDLVESSVAGGFYCYPFLARDRWLDPLRPDDRFARILNHARDRFESTLRVFREAGGEAILGPVQESSDR
jgi:hypothetical protein